MKTISWINGNPGAQADERGYWHSVERRFSISPRYRHTVYPDSYMLMDRMPLGKNTQLYTFDTVREAKAFANDRVAKEHEKDI